MGFQLVGKSALTVVVTGSLKLVIRSIDFFIFRGQVHVPMDFRGSCGKLVSCADLKEERDR